MSEKSGIAIKRPMSGSRSLYETGLTLVHPFFGETKRFEILYHEYWTKYSKEIKDKLHIIVADDCGTPPIHTLMTASKLKRCDINLSILRITDDLKYNTAGALNLGIMAANTEYILIMDSDCIFSTDEMHKIMEMRPEELDRWVYKFPRKRVTNDAHWKSNTRYLPCTMLFHKNLFLDINGFDEDFTGAYSGGYAFFDNHFDAKFKAKGFHFGVIPWIVATEYMDDFVGERVIRSREHENINRQLMYNKINNPKLESKKMLRFSWELAFYNRRTV